MKKHYLLVCILISVIANAQIIDFPDANFKAKLLEADVTNNLAKDSNGNPMKIDANNNGEIEQIEALAVYQLFYMPVPLRNAQQNASIKDRSILVNDISDLTGIAYFTNLRKLDISENLLTSLDVSALNFLTFLDCSHNYLASINYNGLNNLSFFNCSYNNLTGLNVTALLNLATLICSYNELGALDVSNLPAIANVQCDNNQISLLQFGANPLLARVYCNSNDLVSIDLSGAATLILYCYDNPALNSINLSNGAISTLTYEEPPLPFPIDSFNFSNLPALQSICCDPAESDVIAAALNGQSGVTLTTDCIPAIVNIPDPNLKNRLVNTMCASFLQGVPETSYNSRVDTNLDGEIQLSEALAVKGLRIDYSTPGNEIVSIEGLQYFTNLQKLRCGGNHIQTLDVSTMPDLVELGCEYNLIQNLSVSGLPNLDLISCFRNDIATLTLTDLPQLRFFSAFDNQLTTLDVTDLPALIAFECSDNQISNLNVQDLPVLGEILANNNLLESVNLNGLTGLYYLSLNGNLFTNFNLDPIPNVVSLNLGNNAISNINLNGFIDLAELSADNTLLSQIDCSQTAVRNLQASNNPNLTSINVNNNVISQSDPDLLGYAFSFENLPLLTSICLDSGEQNNLLYTNYNSGGNAVVYSGVDCSTLVPMGTSEFAAADFVMIYPNPATSVLHVEARRNASLQSVQIVNALGQVVLSDSHPDHFKNLEIAQFETGTYFIRIISDKGEVTSKFIKY